MLLAAAAAAVDAAFAAVILTLESYRSFNLFDKLWLVACVTGHMGVYASYAVTHRNHRRWLRAFSDYVLWCAMAAAPLLRSKSLLGIAVGSMAGVGALYYMNNKRCVLTGTQWSRLAQFLYFPLLGVQLGALARLM